MLKTCKPNKRKIGLLIVYVGFLFATSLVPMDRPIEGLEFVISIKPTVQNLLHIPVYTLLAILWLQVFQPYEMSMSKKLVLAIVLSSLIGILTECIQIAVPGRYPSLLDTTFNVMGSGLGIVLYYRLYHTSDSLIRRLVCQRDKKLKAHG
jgi:glycopeptide antibiotics resistance protein